ncbi:MAG: glucans biosynthesis glucosyltransferase MdoH [Gammaproteobacteria bacterium]|jgi:membrane glycosyltransferase
MSRAFALHAYLDRLGYSGAERAALLDRLGGLADTPEAEAALHAALGGDTPGEVPAQTSVPARLQRLLGSGVTLEQVTEHDLQGRLRLRTTPSMQRAHMTPRPWEHNPFRRLGRWLRARILGRRGLAAEAPPVPAPAPDHGSQWRVPGRNRRLLLSALILIQTYLASYLMTAVLPYGGSHGLEIAILVLYAVLFAWISAGFWTALMGFWTLLRGRDRYAISAQLKGDPPLPAEGRTALLMPICNENVARVFAGLRATWRSVQRQGVAGHFDVYILSDSSEADTRVAELEAWLRLCREVNGFGHIHYRRRGHRIKRKSGNIADWCRRWGRLYRYFVVLDADSVMSGACLKRLVQLMEAHPGAGIIQTAPVAAGRETLYARMQQFATRLYGPLFTAGLHYWQLGESHYWGHNAILRVAPFMQHCALGRLPGRGALAGEILSHDFVEAALMRRAGWAVWIAYDLPGSFEEMPPSLLDELKRDRRWCQGNLQNFRLFMTRGLHPAHRAVFMTGVMAYLSAPLWFAFLALSTALLAVHTLAEPVYFTEPFQLFPNWPQWHPEWALRLFGGTLGLLFLPKLLALALQVRQGARLYGGPLRLLLSMLGEVLFSALLAPIRMLFHTRFVLTALAGFAIQWKSPPREDASTPWREALRHHGLGSLLGLGWAGLVYWLNPAFLWWLLPVAGSLVIAVPLSVWSSRTRPGRWCRAQRLFLIPEESHPPRELRWLAAALRRAPDGADGFRRAVADPLVNALVCAAGARRLRPAAAARQMRQELLETALSRPLTQLDDTQKNRLLGDPVMMSQLHSAHWQGLTAS